MYETAKAAALFIMLALSVTLQRIVPVYEVLSNRIWRVASAVVIGFFLCSFINKPGERYVAAFMFWGIWVLGVVAMGSGALWREPEATGYPASVSSIVFRISVASIYALTLYGLMVWRINRDGYNWLFNVVMGMNIIFVTFMGLNYGVCALQASEPSRFALGSTCEFYMDNYWSVPVVIVAYIFIGDLLRRLR